MKNKDYTPWLKKIVDYLQDLLKNSREHKEISERQLRQSMTGREQRIWILVQIIVIILFGSGILISLNLFEKSSVADYDVSVKISPDKVVLNKDGNIEFEFTFMNTGRKNITDFRVWEISLYRQEGDELKSYRQLLTPFQGAGYMSCESGYSGDRLDVGKKCVLKEELFGCKECFDDKDKQVMFYIYFKSVPPINNKIVNLTIY